MDDLDLLGAEWLGDAGTGGAPSVPMDYGPSMGPGTVYTDKATISAVQSALKSKGVDPGKIDGIFGPKTEAALYKFSGKHGPPDDATLAQLGVPPGGGSQLPLVRTPQGTFLSPAAVAALAPPSWWTEPAWQGGWPRWQAGAVGGGLLVGVGALLYGVFR